MATKRPRWLWRVLLLLPPVCLWALWLIPSRLLPEEPIERHWAHRLGMQMKNGCLLFGAMPDPGASSCRMTKTDDGRSTVYSCTLSGNEVALQIQQMFASTRAGTRGIVVHSGSRPFVAVALWVPGIILSFLTLPFVNAVRLTRRRSVRRARNHCLACGYDLRGLPSPRCPECGLNFSAPTFS